MNWGYTKDKILVFGENDYVFFDMFLSIIEEFEKVEDVESRMIYTLIMLKELMNEKLVDVYLVSEKKIEEYVYFSVEDIERLGSTISFKWAEINYSLPERDVFFCITTTQRGIECVNNRIFLDKK
ncbi:MULTISPECIES: hypothetical protein [Flavobacterium]|uniref:Uncharacterized protein n=1 Tax=Flavobacterium suzhouense TaxID=1529638 RepID=A0ABW5NQH1_9FLAO|nr:hypothetical protein [Flavobacterium sp. AG291]RDI12023.1 hypothetical protein DEU42_105185 [Flavobacterium sp. AG291]